VDMEQEVLKILTRQFEIQSRESRELIESITQLKETTGNVNTTLCTMNKQFTNGFRHDIKEHVTDASNAQIDILHDINETVTSLTKPAFWVKLFVSFTCALGAIAGILLSIIK